MCGGRIFDNETFPEDELITWARGVDIREPAAIVVDEAVAWRKKLPE